MKKFFLLIIAGLLLTGCTKQVEMVTEETEESEVTETIEEETLSYDGIYNELLDHYFDLLTGDSPAETEEGERGVLYAAEGESEPATYIIGYHIEDISGDGIPECIIGYIDDMENNQGKEIFALYSYIEEPVLIVEGWYRNMYYLLNDGTFFNEGSNGAMYSIFADYSLEKNGLAFICKDYYFTFEKNDNYDIGFYHNTSGEWDEEVSEELDIDEAAFIGYEDAYKERIVNISFIPFKDYDPDGVHVSFIDDCDIDLSEAVTASDNGDNEIVIYADREVLAFSFNAINNVSYDEETAALSYDSESLYECDSFDKPLIFKVTFNGDTPEYNISYTDFTGEIKTYVLSISGYDNSLSLSRQKEFLED